MQAQVLAAFKVGAAHSSAVLASVRVFKASSDTSASASASTSARTYSWQVSCVGAAIVAAVAAVAVAAAGVDCIVFLKDLTIPDQG